MSSLTHEERIVSRCRDVFCNRCTMEWGAQTCGIRGTESVRKTLKVTSNPRVESIRNIVGVMFG